MISEIISFILGIAVTYSAPLVKDLVIKIVTKFWGKADKEVDRWFKSDKDKKE